MTTDHQGAVGDARKRLTEALVSPESHSLPPLAAEQPESASVGLDLPAWRQEAEEWDAAYDASTKAGAPVQARRLLTAIDRLDEATRAGLIWKRRATEAEEQHADLVARIEALADEWDALDLRTPFVKAHVADMADALRALIPTTEGDN